MRDDVTPCRTGSTGHRISLLSTIDVKLNRCVPDIARGEDVGGIADRFLLNEREEVLAALVEDELNTFNHGLDRQDALARLAARRILARSVAEGQYRTNR
jgi:hypothetical protein